ncbi:MAG: hypothetical protein QXZ15_00945 [Candidatus Nitrosocaldaceae archaeon]
MMYETTNVMGYIKSGILGGIFGAWAIFGFILLVESSLGLESGTLYKVIALSLGSDINSAIYLGFIAHMTVGSIIGIMFGLVISRFFPMMDKRILGLGIIAGIITFLVLFLPVTYLLIIPSLEELSNMLDQPMLLKMVEGYTFIAGALSMHIIYGFILGLMQYLGVVIVPKEAQSLS